MGLKGDIRRGLNSVSIAASAASMSVATLAELDLAKSRMEAACSTLQVCLPAPYRDGCNAGSTSSSDMQLMYCPLWSGYTSAGDLAALLLQL